MNALTLFAQANQPDALFGGAIVLVAIMGIIGVALTIFWLWMLVDALTTQPTTEQKILWFLVIFFFPVIGALIYLFVGRTGRASSPGL